MAKLRGKFLYIIFLVLGTSLTAQSLDAVEQDPLRNFKETFDPTARFSFFFNTVNRYSENSAYDWLDEVNILLNNAERDQDPEAIQKYKLIQAQLYYDLGDYEKSLAVANELYANKHDLDLNTQRYHARPH